MLSPNPCRLDWLNLSSEFLVNLTVCPGSSYPILYSKLHGHTVRLSQSSLHGLGDNIFFLHSFYLYNIKIPRISIHGPSWSPIWKADLGTVRILPFILNLMQSNPRNNDWLCVAQFPAEGFVGLLWPRHGEGCPYGLASGLGCLPVCFIFYQSIRCFALQGDCWK